MQIRFVAGIAPIVTDLAESLAFYRDALGLPLPEGDYPATDDLAGVKHFGLWSLSGAAQSCFGSDAWPAELPTPQASVEFDVESAEAVATAAAELADRGHRLLVGPKTEEWGQTVARLLSPEGLLVGITFTPWQHATTTSNA
jgi:catechol 2,3-dioxygenase-like lactoylglutathione lyase family enzyme